MKLFLVLFILLIVISVAYSINSFYEKNACKDRSPDRQLMELSQVYATFTCDKENYGRGRFINCKFYHKLPDAEEEGVEHFLCTVLIKSKEKQNIGVGEFIKWSDSASPVQCKSDINTAIINKDDKTKENITFAWKSPAEDLGELYFSMSYSGSQYHTEVRKNLKFIDYPVSLKECGNRKNCMRYASENKDCDADNCKYAITYGFFDTYRNTVKFTFDIQEEKNSFLAIAFTKNDPKVSFFMFNGKF
ncbi:uncharacterized protein LOC111624345 [Centruroides sculpturatus]|uniref:uncharacterized protein LOC111624345 n=1 Tax=Centruroides sculpturatus TaxID=218467 RepID=UPI000C6EBD8F|nr:uncharacterized protein LOC111624345 [Centruroides sculpturatus]